MDVPPDFEGERVWLTASHPEYLNRDDLLGMSASRKAFTVPPGGRDVQMTLHLGKPNSIRGVLVDAERNPVAGVAVTALTPYESPSGLRYFSVGRSATSNARGEYRITDLPDGRFIVLASPTKIQRAMSPNTPVPAGGLLPTYFPNQLDAVSAQSVFLSGGQTVEEVTMMMRRGKLTEVTGSLANLPAEADLSHATVFLSRRGGSEADDILLRADREGRFKPAIVAEGEYAIAAVVHLPGGTSYGGRSALHVSALSPPAMHVEVPMAPSFSVTGGIRDLEGSALPEWPPGPVDVQVRLVAQDLGLLGATEAVHVGRSGDFRFSSVTPGYYFVVVTQLPSGFFHAGTSFQGMATQRPLVYLNGSGHLTVGVRKGAASIRGVVLDEKDTPLPGSVVLVRRLPESALTAGQNQAFIPVYADSSGRFAYAGVAPGRFVLRAFRSIARSLTIDPVSALELSRSGLEVELTSGEAKELRLRP